VSHVPMPNDAGIQARLLPWLRTGAQVPDAPAACPAAGWHVEVHGVDLPSRRAARAASAGQGLANLERSGAVDVFGFGDDLNVVVRQSGQQTVPLEAPGATLELTPLAGEPTKRALGVFLDCYDKGVMLRYTGDILAVSPPLIIEREQIDRIVDTLRGAIQRAA